MGSNLIVSRPGIHFTSPLRDNPRLARLRSKFGHGDPRITIAILDGPVDLDHESLRNAKLRGIANTLEVAPCSPHDPGPALKHGTAVASIVFGSGEILGLAPGCSGISVPLFTDSDPKNLSGPIQSQAQLADAIDFAVDAGANVINISAGAVTRDTDVDPNLVLAVRKATGSNVLVIAATGDGGCCDRQVPSSLSPVLAVSNLASHPAGAECWTDNCLNVPITNIVAASAGGGLGTVTGSSYATAVVSAMAALMLGDQLRRTGRIDAAIVRRVLCGTDPSGSESAETGYDPVTAWERFMGETRAAGNSPAELADHQLNAWALRTKFRGVEREKFGTVDVLMPTTVTRTVADLHYPLQADTFGMRIVPASDTPTTDFPDGTHGLGYSALDAFLRNTMGLGSEDPIYALLSYIHPEEHQLTAAVMPQTTKLYLGQRHVGAYLGSGRTTQAMSGWGRWRGNGPSDMALNLDRHPANVHIVSLDGVAQATLNRNAQLISLIVASKARVPVSTDIIDCRTVDLTTTLQYYRDLLLDEAYLEDISWFTNCSVHQTLVVNLAVNVPHNRAAFRETFGTDSDSLWNAMTSAYASVASRAFEASDETSFTPLWKLMGIPPSQIRPLSPREYNRYQAAVMEGRLHAHTGRRPLAISEGLAWPLETLFDILRSFVDMYTPFKEAGGLVAASQAIVLRHVVSQRLHIDEHRFLDVAEPLVVRLLVAESLLRNKPGDSGADSPWWEGAAAQLATWVTQGDLVNADADHSPVGRAYVAKVIARAKRLASSIPEPAPRGVDEVTRWYEQAIQPEIDTATQAFVAPSGTRGFCSSPSIFHKLGRSEHPVSKGIKVRTVCTVIDVAHLTTRSATREAQPVAYDLPTGDTGTGPPMDEQRGAEAPDGIAPADSASESSLGQLTWPRNASAQRGRADLHLAATSSEPATGQLVYALGQVAYDFPSRARRESMKQAMDEGSPEDPSSMIAHLEAHPADAAALQWILELEGIPVYFIYPAGPFAGDIFTALRTFLREQIEEGVERVSVPGTVVGAAAHRIGVDLPVIAPELRGMYSWTTEALVSSLQSADGTSEAKKPRADAKSGDVSAGVAAFLDRVYFDLRNPGIADRDRALNYAATNAFSIEHIYEEAIREEMELDTIEVEESAVGIPGLSMWDVKLAFFFPNRPTPSPRRMYRFTVSVEDVIPTTIGPVRSWSVR